MEKLAALTVDEAMEVARVKQYVTLTGDEHEDGVMDIYDFHERDLRAILEAVQRGGRGECLTHDCHASPAWCASCFLETQDDR